MNRAPNIPTGWTGNLTAVAAAQEAFEAGKTEEECFEAAKAAVEVEAEQQAEAADEEFKAANEVLQQRYWEAMCNVVRGVGDLSYESAFEAAATLSIPTVSFKEWKRRIGV